MRDLQAFLIKRFIYILVLVTVAQSLISFLISQAVMPVVMKVFFPDYQRQSSVGKTDLFIFIICVLLLLIVNAVRMLLPSPLQGMMQWTGERLQDWLGNALPATRSSVVVQEMEGWKAILLSAFFAVVGCGLYAASLYFGCDNVRADCDGGVSSDPGGARTAAERV